jgi:hypothetical protein
VLLALWHYLLGRMMERLLPPEDWVEQVEEAVRQMLDG